MIRKLKTCKACKASFAPFLSTAKVCSNACAQSLAVSIRGKAEKVAAVKERKADAVKRDKLKSRSTWLRECQAVVNKVARLRDIHAGHGCISCGAPYQGRFGGAFDGGHYRSVGSAPHLRFYLPQISLQCVKCNRYLSGNATEARKGLIGRHGLERVDAIESMQGEGKWSITYLQRLKKVMARLAGRLEKRIAAKGEA